MNYSELSFAQLEVALLSNTGEGKARFGGLSIAQVNWSSSAESWSVGQCLDHLLTAHGEYLPIFGALLEGRHKPRILERLPLLPRIWGPLLVQAVSPESARRLRAPKIFEPAHSDLDAGIVRRFFEQQEQLLEKMAALAQRRLGEVVITSPVSRFVTYSVLDACRVIVAHGRRHLQQAARVLEMPEFPKA